nr:hypothetical chloroplast RF20 [Poropsis sp. ID1_4]
MIILFFRVVNPFFFSFLIGNLFGTFLNFLRNLFIWDGIIFVIILILFEIINFIIYNKVSNQVLTKDLKNLQFGLLLGFLIDAYKVGS